MAWYTDRGWMSKKNDSHGYLNSEFCDNVDMFLDFAFSNEAVVDIRLNIYGQNAVVCSVIFSGMSPGMLKFTKPLRSALLVNFLICWGGYEMRLKQRRYIKAEAIGREHSHIEMWKQSHCKKGSRPLDKDLSLLVEEVDFEDVDLDENIEEENLDWDDDRARETWECLVNKYEKEQCRHPKSVEKTLDTSF
ncbi:hypothetical protein QVD17_19823 [Tagetes erecta]|uniref:Uncharacterized protein n=1 Tax=Tagetes erecta TaxID=13708 RepID=A0AAD8KN07_TARER|nr:hypothetical protein QVD17_19823 [Tagetes erecta]